MEILNTLPPLDTPTTIWDREDKNLCLNFLAIEVLYAKQRYPEELRKQQFDRSLSQLITRACKMTGKKTNDVQQQLEQELKQRIKEFEPTQPSGPSSWPFCI